MNIDKQVGILKKVLDKLMVNFDSEENKVDFILDICNGYKEELINEK